MLLGITLEIKYANPFHLLFVFSLASPFLLVFNLSYTLEGQHTAPRRHAEPATRRSK